MQLYATIAGTLPRNPEMSYNPTGLAICKFSLPSQIYDSTKKTNETQWVNIVCFDKKAESMAQYCAKGTALLVMGPAKFREYTTKDGRHGVSLEIVADKIEYLKDFGAEYVHKVTAPIDDFQTTTVVTEEQPF